MSEIVEPPATFSGRRLDAVRKRHVRYMVVAQPVLAAVLAAVVLPHRAPGWPELVCFLVLYFAGTIGIGAGYHRLVTHKAGKAPPWLLAVFGVMGCTAGQGSITYWAALHRMHHAQSDADGDPHSPYAGFEGRMWAGFYHAHIGWMFTHAIPAPARWVPELLKNPTVAWLSRTYVAWFVAGQLAPALVVGVVTGSGWGALSGLLWAGLVRTILVQHVIWSINSVCHIIGARPYPSRDYSRNVGWLALVSCGESWHNNHHAQPTSAVHGFDRGQVDLSGLVLRGLARIGLIEGLRLPNERTLLRLRGDRAVQLGDTAGARRAWEQARALAVQEDAQGIVADIDRAIAGLGR